MTEPPVDGAALHAEIAELRAEFTAYRVSSIKDMRQQRLITYLSLVATLLGAIVLYGLMAARDSRREEVNSKLHDLACLGLVYIPKSAPAAQKVLAEFPDCPPVSSKAGLPTTSSTPTRKPSATSTALSAPRSTVSTVRVPVPARSVPSTPSARTAAARTQGTQKPRSTPRGEESSGASTSSGGLSPRTVAPHLCALGVVCLTIPVLLN